MEEFKDRLRTALEVNHMMPVDLAKKCGINKGLISKYLNGLVVPKQSNIAVIAEALGVSPLWLLGFEQDDSEIQVSKLNPKNQARLFSYYQALIDSQEEQ